MARKPNHAWEKRQKEVAKQAKRAEKREKKRISKEAKDLGVTVEEYEELNAVEAPAAEQA